MKVFIPYVYILIAYDKFIKTNIIKILICVREQPDRVVSKFRGVLYVGGAVRRISDFLNTLL